MDAKTASAIINKESIDFVKQLKQKYSNEYLVKLITQRAFEIAQSEIGLEHLLNS